MTTGSSDALHLLGARTLPQRACEVLAWMERLARSFDADVLPTRSDDESQHSRLVSRGFLTLSRAARNSVTVSVEVAGSHPVGGSGGDLFLSVRSVRISDATVFESRSASAPIAIGFMVEPIGDAEMASWFYHEIALVRRVLGGIA